MRKTGILLMTTSILIGIIIDCNGFKEVELPVIISFLTFLSGIYLLILSDNKVVK